MSNANASICAPSYDCRVLDNSSPSPAPVASYTAATGSVVMRGALPQRVLVRRMHGILHKHKVFCAYMAAHGLF
eukprot:scaffold237652_cov33-Tisochrysis_lutea.AAC.2